MNTTIAPGAATTPTIPGDVGASTTTVVGATTTIAPNELPGAVVSEAASPAVMGVVGVGVAALVINGLLLLRRRRDSKGTK